MLLRSDDRNTGLQLQESLPESGQGDRYSGYRVLWMRVIQRALFDWVLGRNCKDDLVKLKRADMAYRWLFERNELFNSFENVCASLGIDPGQLRERALAMTEDDVKKIEHMERDSQEEEPSGVLAAEPEEEQEDEEFTWYSVRRRRRLLPQVAETF